MERTDIDIPPPGRDRPDYPTFSPFLLLAIVLLFVCIAWTINKSG